MFMLAPQNAARLLHLMQLLDELWNAAHSLSCNVFKDGTDAILLRCSQDPPSTM
jgi:hypothetical protein